MNDVARALLEILLWGMIGTWAMIAVMYASQNFGWSRLNMPFLLGTGFTADRREANVLGFVLYWIVGWLFALIYYLILAAIGHATWWVGALVGAVHGLLLLTAILPLLPYMHPRVASEYDGPTPRRTLEPPGFLALHYGYRTPLITLVAQALYGAILGAGFHI
ncbi:MAG TPA: hypothetical protein VFB54_05190 [Burkholderiales bacterium]|nr:hypothetical protein [Burkholderiales bacterium]